MGWSSIFFSPIFSFLFESAVETTDSYQVFCPTFFFLCSLLDPLFGSQALVTNGVAMNYFIWSAESPTSPLPPEVPCRRTGLLLYPNLPRDTSNSDIPPPPRFFEPCLLLLAHSRRENFRCPLLMSSASPFLPPFRDIPPFFSLFCRRVVRFCRISRLVFFLCAHMRAIVPARELHSSSSFFLSGPCWGLLPFH